MAESKQVENGAEGLPRGKPMQVRPAGVLDDEAKVQAIGAARAAVGLPFTFRVLIQVYDPESKKNVAWGGRGFAVEAVDVRQARAFLEVLAGVIQVMAAVEDPKMVLDLLLGEGSSEPEAATDK